MKNEIPRLMLEIREKLIDFLLALKTGGLIKKDKAKEVEGLICKLLKLHKGELLIEKWFIAELYSVPDSIRNEIEYLSDQEFLNNFSNKIEEFFGMLLAGEEPSDRAPGVPRFF